MASSSNSSSDARPSAKRRRTGAGSKKAAEEPILTAVMEEAATFQKAIDAIKDLVSNARFQCSKEGIWLQEMDSAHVSLIHLNLKASAFESIECARPFVIGMNLESLSKLMSCGERSAALTLQVGPDQDYLTVMFEDRKKRGVFSVYRLATLEIDNENLDIPEIEYQCTLELPSAWLRKECSNLMKLGLDQLSITATRGGAVIFGGEGDLGEAKIVTRKSDADADPADAVDVACTKDTSTLLALRYVCFFSKAATLAGRVQVSISDDVPVRFRYASDVRGEHESMEINYFLAPKMTDDD